jgi:alpha-tubulin suppressor-like RCC1 family protein
VVCVVELRFDGVRNVCAETCHRLAGTWLARVLLTAFVSAIAGTAASGQTVAAGEAHTVILKSDGTVWTMGYNGYGQLGDGTTTGRMTPIQVSGLTDVVAVAAGRHTSMAITSTGALYVWGWNGNGQVGDGTTTSRSTPVQSALTNVVAIAGGEKHSVALISNGDVYTWGSNGNGQLGNGSTTQSAVPVLAVTGAVAIGAGASHTLFVKSDGTVLGAGSNSYGQLGDGSTTQRTSPAQMSGISTATAVAGGTRHSLILLSNGTVKATGFNGDGELGDNTVTQRTSPVSVSGLAGVNRVAAGFWHSLALKSDGTVKAWGYNYSGQLGDGNPPANAIVPTTVGTLSDITSLAGGGDHGVAVSSTGVVFTWGNNSNSQLGDGTTINRSSPVAVSDAGYYWKVSTPTLNVASGTYNTDRTVTVAITTAGATIYYTRNGSEPSPADSTVSSGGTVTVSTSQTLKVKAFKTGMAPSTTTAGVYVLKVVNVGFSPAPATFTTPTAVALTTSTSGATIRYTTDGTTPTASSTLYSVPFTVATSTVVKAIGVKTDWADSNVATGIYTMYFGTLALPTADQAEGSYTNSVTVALSAFSGATIRYTSNDTVVQTNSPVYTAPFVFDVSTVIRFKAYHPDYQPSAEVRRSYTLVAATPVLNPTAGTYTAGQAITVASPSIGTTMRYTINGAEPGTGDPVVASGGTLVMGNFTLKVKAWKAGAVMSTAAMAAYSITGEVASPRIVAGMSHALATKGDGVVWAWGANGYGQLGDGTATKRMSPQLVTGLTGAVAMAAGNRVSHAQLSNGSAVGFGGGGLLGDGTNTAQWHPFAVSALNGVVSISDGQEHSLALKTDGTVVAWGTNSYGALGDGTTTTRQAPVAVSGLTNVSVIVAARVESYALKQDGTVWSWGANGNAQLGDGTTTNRWTPVQVSGLSTVTKIAGGGAHVLALLANGTVKSWGWNYWGQLGDGTGTQRGTPVSVALLSDVVAVGAGYGFSVALTNDGTVWTWGDNQYGQLGNGTNTQRSTPAALTTLSGITQIAVGSNFALAADADGRVWTWGHNGDGQLGDGSTTNRNAPFQIAGVGMNWRVLNPTISVASGLYYASQSVVVAVADPSATLHYTLTGVDPTTGDATVASGGTVTIEQSQTLNVSAWKTGAPTSAVVGRTYELKAVTPVITPGTGTYGSSQSVAMTSTTSGATLRYTTDGSEPNSGSLTYSSTITVAETQTVKARAYKSGWTASDSSHASFWINGGTVATPTISPSGGTQASPPMVSMSTSTSGATVRYTLDGTTPGPESAIFGYPFLVPVTTTVTARAFKAGYTPSANASLTYGVDAAGATATPSIVPAGGWHAIAQTVTITGPSGATLRYTTDGSNPTTSSSSITSGGTLTVAKSQVLKVRAWASGLEPSAPRRADFVITGAIAAGTSHSLALASDGGLWAFGSDWIGQLGNGPGGGSSVPIQVLTGVVSAAAGDRHSLAAKADGTVWAWGDASRGKLGTGGSQGSYASPTQISFTGAVAVAAAYQHSLVLKSDGTVWAFGENDYGQLGDGTLSARNSPVQVVGISNIVAIAIGREASYALQRDGARGGIVWAWGRNTYAQLGDGSTLSRATPTRVTGLPDVTTIAAGKLSNFALAIGADGRVYGWGENANAQLGLGTSGNQTSAMPLPSIAAARVIGAGSDWAAAVDSTGRAWAWGNSSLGALGIGPGSSQYDRAYVPEQSDINGVLSLAGGDAHLLGIAPNGTIRGFGQNSSGVLGDGTSTTATNGTTAVGLTLADNTFLAGDADGDELATWREYLLGTDPLNPDSNGNGVMDGHDDASGASAADPDLDDDGLPNWDERLKGTDPFRADTDGDSVSDLNDAFPLDPTRSMAPSANPSDTTPPIVTLKEPVTARPIP